MMFQTRKKTIDRSHHYSKRKISQNERFILLIVLHKAVMFPKKEPM